MSASPEFTVGLDPISLGSVNGKVSGRVVLQMDGKQCEIDRLSLDSHLSRTRTAQRWSKKYGVDSDAVLEKLNAACSEAIARETEVRERRQKKHRASKRVSALAARYVAELKLEWHRNGRSVFSGKAGREIAVGSLWTLATDTWIDETGDTTEAIEAGDLNYRGRLGLFREAIVMAASRAIKRLPEWADVDQDQTVTPETLRGSLLDSLIAWLLAERTFRTDNGTAIVTSVHQWASGLEIGSGWQKCHTMPVFGRLDDSDGQPQIAVKGEVLTSDLRADSSRKLAAALQENGLLKTDLIIKVTGKNWRLWQILPVVLDSIVTGSPDDA